jgi:two-component system, OmpR family, KDP operon response regulator KdpE
MTNSTAATPAPRGTARRAKVLVVDDEPRVVRLVTEILRAVGYQVVAASSGDSGLEALALEQPALVLLDVLLGSGPNGFEVCKRIREFSDVAVIMLTAKAMESDVLAGFEAGADDYLTKPFSAKELVARVQAVLRRSERALGETVTSTFSCGALSINFARHAVEVHGRVVALTRTEYALLHQLALNANRVLSHEELLVRVWGPEYRDDVDYLRAYIRYLRRKLEDDPGNPRYILTSPGAGYLLACPEAQ